MRFVKRKELEEATGLSGSSIKKMTMENVWTEGVHYFRYSSRLNLFNLELIQDWLVNRNNPHVHQRAVEGFLRALPSNQPKHKRG